MVVFQVLTWETQDTEDEHLISIFGKTKEGKSVCVTTSFTPYFFLKLPKKTSQMDIDSVRIFGTETQTRRSTSWVLPWLSRHNFRSLAPYLCTLANVLGEKGNIGVW